MSDIYVARSASESASAILAKVAVEQHGVFSRAQAIDCGINPRTVDRRVATGEWHRLYAGVYRLAASRPTWRQALLAACLIWGDGAVISHRAAGALWRLAGFTLRIIELSLPRRRERGHLAKIHVPKALGAVDVTSLDGIPVTTPERTIIDLASCAPVDTLEEALDDALRRGLLSFAKLRWRLEELRGPGREGSAVLNDLIEARKCASTVPETVFETRLLRVLRQAGLPLPALQHRVATPRGEARLDFAYLEEKIAIEADGFRWHSSRRQWDNDRQRGNALTMLGWTIIRVTWTQLNERPDEVVETVRVVLASLTR